MSRKDLAKLILIAGMSGIISLILTSIIFSSAQKPTKVPVVQPLSSDFPLVKNDPNYQAIFNDKALDPTQLIQIGPSQNTTPFNGQQ